MSRATEFLLGFLAVSLLGLAAWWLVRDVRNTLFVDSTDVRIVELPQAKDGWFPAPQQPVFSWEEAAGLEGWRSEDDAPLELSQTAPAYQPSYRDGPDGEPERIERPDAEKDDEAEGEAAQTISAALALAAGQGTDGEACLRIPVRFPDPATIFRKASPLSGVRYIAYDVFVPEGVQGFVGCLFFLKDKDGLWYQARSHARLLPGRWTTVTADIRGGSPDVTPLGHLGQWEENQASQVRTVGITFYGDAPYHGHVLVDNFRGWMRSEKFVQAVAKAAAGRVEDITPERREELERLAEEAQSAPAEPLMVLNLRSVPHAELSPGASPPTVGRYETLEYRFETNRSTYNPFDLAQADVEAQVTSPSGRTMRVFGFWHQDFQRQDYYDAEELAPSGRPEWRVRITPVETGPHTVRITVKAGGETVETPELEFVAAPSNARGFVRVSKVDPNYFECDDGSFYYPLGHNVHTPVDLRCWSQVFKEDHPLQRGLRMYEDFFPRMAAAGENTVEIWMASWWVGIEWTRRWRHYHGPGRYSLENAWRLDRLLDEARRHGLRVHLVIDNHGKFSEWCDWEWDQNPYNKRSDHDGMVYHPTEFFTNERARELHKQRLRYIAARWGGDPAVMGWELVSEFDLVGDGQAGRPGRAGRGDRNYCKSPPARAWVREMIGALREYDPYERPVTNHYASDFNIVDRELASSPALDYVTGDAYYDQGRYACFPFMAQAWDRQYGNLNKPYWVTEFGGNWNAASPARLEADLHAGLWSAWMTRAGGAPLFWWYDFVDRRGHYKHYRAFANYAANEDKRRLHGATEFVNIYRSNGNLRGLQYRWGEGAYAWIFDQTAMSEMPDPALRPRHAQVEALVSGLAEGRYQVEYWDTYEGTVVLDLEHELKPGEQLTLRLPEFRSDLAVKVKRRPAATPSSEYPPSHAETEAARTPPASGNTR